MSATTTAPPLPLDTKENNRAYPIAVSVVKEMIELSPTLMANQINYQWERHGTSFLEVAERLLSYSESMDGDPAQSLLEYTVVYLREQARFVNSGEYAHSEFETAYKEVYDNAEVMDGFYLEGLMLTHAFWPIHYDIHQFFESQFLSRVADGTEGAEFGFGHGLYLHDLLEAKPSAKAFGYDISSYSKKFAHRLLNATRIPEERFELAIADVRDPLPCADGKFSWTLFAEILEHIPDPHGSLREVRRTMKPGGISFLTTVINSNAIDHLWHFTDVAEIDAMVRDAGFEVLRQQLFAVNDYGTAVSDPTVDVAYVCQAV